MKQTTAIYTLTSELHDEKAVSAVTQAFLTSLGISGFQANPSSINPETGEIIFAHCTIPLNMVERYELDTHFESGIGTGIRGYMKAAMSVTCPCGILTQKSRLVFGILQHSLFTTSSI